MTLYGNISTIVCSSRPIDKIAPLETASEEEATTCFICLESEGRMLVNVCDCKWSRVHQRCLAIYVEATFKTPEEAKCRVCKKSIQVDAPPSLAAEMWGHLPCMMVGLLVASVAVVGFNVALITCDLFNSQLKCKWGVGLFASVGIASVSYTFGIVFLLQLPSRRDIRRWCEAARRYLRESRRVTTDVSAPTTV